MTLYAVWRPHVDVVYTVHHYYAPLDWSDDDEEETETLYGTVGEQTAAQAHPREGFYIGSVNANYTSFYDISEDELPQTTITEDGTYIYILLSH